jgi:hypothetical protein
VNARIRAGSRFKRFRKISSCTPRLKTTDLQNYEMTHQNPSSTFLVFTQRNEVNVVQLHGHIFKKEVTLLHMGSSTKLFHGPLIFSNILLQISS